MYLKIAFDSTEQSAHRYVTDSERGFTMDVQFEANEWNGANAYVTGCDELEFMPRLDDSTQYSTVFVAGRPVATLQRRSALDYGRGPVWTLYATDGALVRKWLFAPSYAALARGTALALRRANLIRTEAR